MLGLNSRIDGVFGNLFDKLFVAELVKLRAENSLRRVGDYAELAAYGDCGILVVAGYHYRGYARAAALLDSRLDFGADGVYHAGKSDEHEVAFKRLGLKGRGDGIVISKRNGENAQSLVRHSLVVRGDFCPELVVHGNYPAVYKRGFAKVDNNVGRTLCVLNYAGSRLMDGGHHLSSGVERSFADSGTRLDEVILAHAQGIGVSDESGLGGLARDLAGVVYLSVGAKSHSLGYELLIVAEMIDNGHLVLGQSARLVGADYLSAAESLNCGKLTDKSLPLAHRGNAYGKDYRDDCRQSLGYGSDRKSDCGNERAQRGVSEQLP